MCGIAWILFDDDKGPFTSPSTQAGDDDNPTSTSSAYDVLRESLSLAISRRGPDLPTKSISMKVEQLHGSMRNCCLMASVLHLRGDAPMEQPMIRSDENHVFALAWNGECYGGPISSLEDDLKFSDESDTGVIMSLIQSAIVSAEGSNSDATKEIANALKSVKGEYSFIFYHFNKNMDSHRLYFGRDCLGRRSLLIHRDKEASGQSQKFVLSSVIGTSETEAFDFEEVLPGKIYNLDVQTMELQNLVMSGSVKFSESEEQSPTLVQRALEVTAGRNISSSMITAAANLHEKLSIAVKRRVNAVNRKLPQKSEDMENIASIGVLFSGGIDSVVLAALAHIHVPSNEAIDLINVAFSSGSITGIKTAMETPDRIAAILSYRELMQKWPNRNWRFVSVDVEYDEVLENEQRICSLIHPLSTQMDFNIGAAMWFASGAYGSIDSSAIPEPTNKFTSENNPLVRFSRKVNLSDPPEKSVCSRHGCEKYCLPGCVFSACRLCCTCYQKPISSFLAGPSRVCFAHLDTKKKKAPKSKQKTRLVQHTRSPLSQKKSAKSFTKNYKSPAKVMLLGIGADELMAGYGRHRKVYEKGGYVALENELKMEAARIWTRNLGRDDRCISDQGREARFPFLDEDVVRYLTTLPITDICDMKQPPGEGDKMILRIVAKMLGVEVCSNLVKRAIQFGSRVAKASDVYHFGSSRNANGKSIHPGSK